MKKSLLLAAIVAAMATPTLAADEIVSPSAPKYDWSGLYVGALAGYGWGSTDWTYTGTTSTADHNTKGPLGGVTAGYNWDLGNNFVVGVEGVAAVASISGSSPCPNPAFSCESKIKSLFSARARFGYAAGPVLFYGTGGYGGGHVRVQTVLPGGTVPTSGTSTNGESKFLSGWAAGAGVEYAFSNNWSVKAEYMHYGLGSKGFIVDNLLPVTAKINVDTIRIGANFKF